MVACFLNLSTHIGIIPLKNLTDNKSSLIQGFESWVLGTSIVLIDAQVKVTTLLS